MTIFPKCRLASQYSYACGVSANATVDEVQMDLAGPATFKRKPEVPVTAAARAAQD